MSEENVEIVTRGIAAAVARPEPDYSTVNELYSPDHVLVPVGADAGIEGEGTGAEGYRAWREEIQEFLSAEIELQGAIDVGPGKVLAVVITRFEGTTSGAASEQRIWNVVTVRGGRIVRTEAFTDPSKALRVAAGLSE
jgi:ketosteroid isomerase-like protein